MFFGDDDNFARIETTDGGDVIHITGEIGWWGSNHEGFINRLKYLSGGNLTVIINSGGGSLTDGLAIASEIARYKGRVTTIGTGLVASAATFILFAGDVVTVDKGTLLMIHNASTLAYGGVKELEKSVEILTISNEIAAAIYTDHVNELAGSQTVTTDEIKAMMDDETWFTPLQAKELGFIHSINPRKQKTA